MTMVTYVVLTKFTDQGIRNAKDSPKRADAFKQMAKTFGVTVKDIFWTQGRYDIVTIVEAPDESAAMSLNLSLGALGIVRTATMDAFGHHIARHRAASIEVVARKPFADDVAVGHHPDQSVVLPNRNAADVMLPHHFREYGDRGVGADPVDTLVHHVFDFHGGPPLLEFLVHFLQRSTAPLFSTIQPLGPDGTRPARPPKERYAPPHPARTTPTRL